MQSLSVCALVVLSLASLALAAPFPCTFDNGGTKYDLSNMYRDPSKGQTDFNSVFTDGSTFNVNVCGQAASTLCSPANGVCQVITGNPPAGYGNGDASKAAWAAYPGDAQGVQLTYPTGSGATCPGGVMRKSILNIKCDSSANDGVIDSMSESTTPPCTYTINMRSKWACPGKNGGGGGGGGGSGGLSPGSIILITVACVIPVYLVVGGIIKWKVYGAEPLSIDIIPNVDFWTALPFLVKDGSVYFVRKVTFNKVCGEYSEI